MRLPGAVSISSNIAEGSSRSSRADYVRFVEIATASVFEVVSQATIGHHQGFLTEAEYQHLYQADEKQSKMLSGLKRSLESARTPQPSTSFTRIKLRTWSNILGEAH